MAKLTEYERKRLENIRRNDEMMAAFKIRSKASELSASTKRQRVGTKSYNDRSEKKEKAETSVVIRRSLRTRGMPPDSKGLDPEIATELFDESEESPSESKYSPKFPGPLSMSDAYSGNGSDRKLIEAIRGLANEKPHDSASVKDKSSGRVSCMEDTKESDNDNVKSCIKLDSWKLNPDNIARIVTGRITSVRFFPSSDLKIIMTGNKFGNVGFWHMGSDKEDENGVYVYYPHSAPISGILVRRPCLSKVFTSCYNGFIRLMDTEKEVFDLVFSSDDAIFSLSQQTSNSNCLYFGEGGGGLNIWDDRIGACSSQWLLHEDRINTIDFNSSNPHLMATGSTDGTARIWDLRRTDGHKPEALRTFSHQRAVHSAYFSPSGSSLATTSIDNSIGILTGVNFEEASSIPHNNQTGRWLSSFRAIWGWDDSYVFIGNMKRGVDIISPARRRTIFCLEGDHMSAIPCRLDANPFEVGMLAGATSGGQVYVWTFE